MPDERIVYCIENQQPGTGYGKHHYAYDDDFGMFCKFCFLPKDKANYKPMKRTLRNKFKFVELKIK